jgi:DNA-binding PadR family transcriptional regulator
MPHENKTRYAVLGLLNSSPMTGYQMRKIYERSLGHFWSESYSHLYAILKVLETEGLATSTVEPGDGRPDRRVYAITEAGREVLTEWLARPADEPRERVEVLLKVFHGGAVGPAVVAGHLGTFRAQQEALLARYAQYAADLQEHMAEDPSHDYILLTLRCGQAISKALREWCDESLATLAGLPDGKPGTSGQVADRKAGS